MVGVELVVALAPLMPLAFASCMAGTAGADAVERRDDLLPEASASTSGSCADRGACDCPCAFGAAAVVVCLPCSDVVGGDDRADLRRSCDALERLWGNRGGGGAECDRKRGAGGVWSVQCKV